MEVRRFIVVELLNQLIKLILIMKVEPRRDADERGGIGRALVHRPLNEPRCAVPYDVAVRISIWTIGGLCRPRARK